jgi:hypothetical protein
MGRRRCRLEEDPATTAHLTGAPPWSHSRSLKAIEMGIF